MIGGAHHGPESVAMADPSGHHGIFGRPIAACVADFECSIAIGSGEDIVLIRRGRAGPLSGHHFSIFVEE